MSLSLREVSNIYSGADAKEGNAQQELDDKQEQAMKKALNLRSKNGR